MVTFFPTPVSGETVSSLVCRYVARSAFGIERTLDSIGLRGVKADCKIPSRITQLVAAMPPGHPLKTHDIVLSEHSILPYHLFFASQSTRELTIHRLLQPGSVPDRVLHLTRGMKGRPSLPPRFCPDCVREDEVNLGFSCFYRHHQPRCVLVCARHQVPLHSGCRRCELNRANLTPWHMAGWCECGRAEGDALLDSKVSDKCMDDLMWFARGCQFMLEADITPDVDLRTVLRNKLLTGYATRNGIDAHKTIDAITQRFEQKTLELLDLTFYGGASLTHWPARSLSKADEVSRLHDPVRLQALTGLCCTSMAELLQPISLFGMNSRALPPEQLRCGYGLKPLVGRDRLEPKLIEDALKDAKGQHGLAASRLGVSTAHFVGDARFHGVRIPLSPKTITWLGEELIAKAKTMLRDGIPKTEIDKTLGITDFARTLIEADAPGLSEQHRIAVVAKLRERHRAEFAAALDTNVSAGRTELEALCHTAYNWLRRFDREWFLKHIPSTRVSTAKRSPHRKWPSIDDRLAKMAVAFHKRCMNSDIRPRQITRYRILKGIGFLQVLTAQKRSLLPQLCAALEALAESNTAFVTRRLRWAMTGYKRGGEALNVKYFNRLAALSALRLKQNRQQIKELALEFGVTIDPRSPFAD